MGRVLIALIVLVIVMLSGREAYADGTQYSPTCNSIAWKANTEPDLAGYRLYDHPTLGGTPTLIKTFGAQVTTATCASLGLNAGQHYFSISAIDTSGNEGVRSADIPFVIVNNNQVSNLVITVINATDMTLAWTEVDDGTGAPATYDVRLATPTINWPTASSVTAGTCSTPVAGTTIGATKSCTVTGLATTTPYQFQLVPYRGTLGSGTVVFGPLSNIASGTTGSAVPVTTSRYIITSDNFNRANNTSLGASWTVQFSLPWSIVSNVLQTPTTPPVTSRQVHTAVMPDRQWACVTVATIGGTAQIWTGVTLRTSTSADTQYQFLASRNTASRSLIEKRVGGVLTTLTSENATTWANGDQVCGEADGTTLRLYRNSTLILTVSDSSIASGSAGVQGYLDTAGVSTNLQLDNFSAGGFDDRITLFTDTFTRSNGALGSDWQGGYPSRTSATIVSNAAVASLVNSETLDTFATLSLPNDHWIEATVSTLSASGGWNAFILALRAAAPPGTARYTFSVTNQSGAYGTTLYGPSGIIAQMANAWVSGDVVRADVKGSTLRIYQNNLLIMTVTDTAIGTGARAGFGVYSATNVANVALTTVSIGSFASAVADSCGCDQH